MKTGIEKFCLTYINNEFADLYEEYGDKEFTLNDVIRNNNFSKKYKKTVVEILLDAVDRFNIKLKDIINYNYSFSCGGKEKKYELEVDRIKTNDSFIKLIKLLYDNNIKVRDADYILKEYIKNNDVSNILNLIPKSFFNSNNNFKLLLKKSKNKEKILDFYFLENDFNKINLFGLPKKEFENICNYLKSVSCDEIEFKKAKLLKCFIESKSIDKIDPDLFEETYLEFINYVFKNGIDNKYFNIDYFISAVLNKGVNGVKAKQRLGYNEVFVNVYLKSIPHLLMFYKLLKNKDCDENTCKEFKNIKKYIDEEKLQYAPCFSYCDGMEFFDVFDI